MPLVYRHRQSRREGVMLVDKRALQVTTAASTDPTRYVLGVVRVRDDGHFEATDGTILIKVPLPPQTLDECPEGWENPGDKMVGSLLSAGQLKELDKRLKIKGRQYPTRPFLQNASIAKVDDKKAAACFGLDGDRQGIELIEGQYPNTDKIWPKPETKYHHEVAIGAGLLRKIADLATEGQVIFRFPKDNTQAISFTALGKRHVQGIVMPMRM